MKTQVTKTGAILIIGAILLVVLSCGLSVAHNQMGDHTASSLGCEIITVASQFLTTENLLLGLTLLFMYGLVSILGLGALFHNVVTSLLLLLLRIPKHISHILECFRKGIIHSQVYA